jgi:lipase maturation factor 1
MEKLVEIINWLLGPETGDDRRSGHLWPRWIFLRALGLIYFSAFYSLYFQIKGLIGPDGILPAGGYLRAVAQATDLPGSKFWFAPSLLWLGSSDHALMLLTWIGLVASILVVVNFWPRATLAICFLCFLSFIAAAQDFASYQSDGMLLEAGFISLFFAPPGIWPGLARAHGPSRLSLFLLRWEWLQIYFESGVVKKTSGDQSWRHLTAMDDYYQNCPLPTWIGYYVQHLPHWFHASTVVLTFAIELGIVWLMFLPRRFKIIGFCIVTPFEIGIILTANYAFLNYIVLALGFLLLDDRVLERVLPQRLRALIDRESIAAASRGLNASWFEAWRSAWRKYFTPLARTISAVCLGIVFYASTAQIIWTLAPDFPLSRQPAQWLAPFRIAEGYGLFANMTHQRLEIEFQGSSDGKTWIPYPFRYKPQDPSEAPGIYAPYQPRFEWNLWFASLGSWRQYEWVVTTEARLLEPSRDVLQLFAKNPFPAAPPKEVRAVVYQYWFTDLKTKHETGMWWRRQLLGEYAPAVEMQSNGTPAIIVTPNLAPQEQ